MSQRVPFDFQADSFRSSFFSTYMRPLAEWLAGSDHEGLAAQRTNSPWESALSMMYLIRVVEIASTEDPAWGEAKRGPMVEKARRLSHWLCDDKIAVPPEPVRASSAPPSDLPIAEVCWENVTWDTGTVTRSLVVILTAYSRHFDDQLRRKIASKVLGAIQWQVRAFKDWRTEGIYAFGSADIACVALCLARFIEFSGQVEASLSPEDKPTMAQVLRSAHTALVDVIEYLLQEARTPDAAAASEPARQLCVDCWWDDYFTTSEVVEALGEFLLLAHKLPESAWLAEGDETARQHDLENMRDLSERIRQRIVGAMHYFEISQSSGMWGSHIDTIKALHVYTRIGSLLPNAAPTRGVAKPQRPGLGFEPEVHIAFKALRWICDRKQFFSDKSFMHTMFLSSFCAHTFLSVYDFWEKAKLSTAELFDEVIWAAPVRSADERAERAKVELDFERFRRKRNEEIDRLENEKAALAEQSEDARLWNNRTLATVITLAAIIFALTGFGLMSVRLDNDKADAIVGVVGTGAAIWVGLLAIIEALTRRPK